MRELLTVRVFEGFLEKKFKMRNTSEENEALICLLVRQRLSCCVQGVISAQERRARPGSKKPNSHQGYLYCVRRHTSRFPPRRESTTGSGSTREASPEPLKESPTESGARKTGCHYLRIDLLPRMGLGNHHQDLVSLNKEAYAVSDCDLRPRSYEKTRPFATCTVSPVRTGDS